MKLLVIGIDGGDQRIFEHMDMPFLHGLLKKTQSVGLEEDLWTRGWVEILSGYDVSETGGAYTKPVLNENEYLFTQSFKKTDYYINKEITPLWELLVQRGGRLGIMNWPTTGPASEISGFFVAGAGGGSGKSGAAETPSEAVYPKNILPILNELDYIFDTRFRASGIKDFTTLMKRLSLMQSNRTESFIELSEKFDIETGMICFRASTIVQYLAMADIEAIIEGKGLTKQQEKIQKFYRNLDKHLSKLFDELNADEFLIVSDHGSEPRKGTINLNQFLVEKEYLSFESPLMKFPKKVLNKLYGIAGKKPKYGLPIKCDKTKAFTGRYISGMYINDVNRFQGPVKEDEIDGIVNEIVEVFNAYPQAQKHKLKARPYRRNFKESFKYDLLPDIWVDGPDSLFFEAKGKFVEENHEYGPLGEPLEHVTRDQYTGTKGRHPLFVCSKGLSEHIQEEDDRNLTLAYKVIERYTKNNG